MIKPENKDTLFIFPEHCSLGVVESRLDDLMSPVRLSVVDLNLRETDHADLQEVLMSLRKTASVRLTQLPGIEKDADAAGKNNLVISFHDQDEDKRDWENPLLAAVISMGQQTNATEFAAFNDYIVRLESLGLSLDFGTEISVVMLLDLLAVGSALFETTPAVIGNYFLKPVYYGEFLPALPNSLEPIMHALGHRWRSRPATLNEKSVNLSGLIPEGLA